MRKRKSHNVIMLNSTFMHVQHYQLTLISFCTSF